MRITYGFISADLLFFSWSVNVSMKKKTDRLCLLLMLLILCCCAGARGEETMNCYTDKSMYAPGETICLQAVEMPPQTQWLRLTVFHLEQTVLTQTLPAQEEISLSLPEQDGAGYLVRVQALDARQNELACADTAVDVSSSWTKFPRYGYVWDFTQIADAPGKIAAMARYHINGVQFYDWQYRHHQPVADDLSAWQDWSGRMIYGDTVRAYLEAAHARGMACMAYNMIYAANQTYLTDGSGVSPEWRLVKAGGQDFTCDMDAKRGPVGVLQYFNPLNAEWQKYIFAQENKTFEAFAFC